MNEEIRIMASCYSKKTGASIGFGIYFDPNEIPLSELGSDWIYEGLGTSFWENYQEFEQGVAEAQSSIPGDVSDESYSVALFDALYRVFGDFEIEYEVNGEVQDLDFAVDVNAEMYNMLPDIFVDDAR